MREELLRLYGTTEPPPEERTLRAGPLSAIFTGGGLRGISVRGVEVIRGIDFLVRDRRWGTLTPTLSGVAVEETGRAFKVRFEAHGRGEDGALSWRGGIDASVEDGLTFRCSATAEADFPTCRTGFVVLHPLAGVVGCPVTIEHGDGRRERTLFPDLVDPLQPFTDVRAMTHAPLPGLEVSVRMEGDAPWETEDHRNWLDASFKTYFRPLAMPWPYVIPAGATLEQTVRLTFMPAIGEIGSSAESGPVSVAVGDRTGAAMPEIGLSCLPGDLDAAEATLGHLEGIGIQTLAVRVAAGDADLPGTLRRYARLAAALRAAPLLEVVLPLRSPATVELDLVAAAAGSAGLVPRSIAVSPEIDLHSFPPSVDRPPSPPLSELYAAARAAFPGVPLGGGMFSFFTELNRRRPPAHLLDFVQHATSAIVHAADDRSVMETLESLAHVIRSTSTFTRGLPCRLGPAHIGMALNPYGAATTPNPERVRRAMADDDPRAGAQFGAAWTAGYLARAVGGGVAGVTIGSPGGPRGIAHANGPRPAFHVVQSFAAAAGAAVLGAASSDPRRVLAAACEAGGRRLAWLANLTAREQPLELTGFRPARAMVLDGDEPRPADGIDALPAYAVAFLEG